MLGNTGEDGPSPARLLGAPVQAGMVQATVGEPVAPAVPADEAIDGCVTGPGLSKAIACICCPNVVQAFGWLTQVDQNQQKAVLYWGKYHGTLTEPGMFCVNPWGRELRPVSTKYDTLNLKDIKVLDARGSPVIVSGVVTYALTSAKRASIDVATPGHYITLQATAVLKQVAGRYPYSSAPGQPSLQTEGPALATELVRLLQQKVAIAGATVYNFELVDLSYAPEIAQVMLVKQQAEALVEARRLIVGAAVDMTQQAVAQLEASGQALSDSARERVTSNLLAVICSHSNATPTVPLN